MANNLQAEEEIRPRNFTDTATDSDLQNAENYLWFDTVNKAKKLEITRLAKASDVLNVVNLNDSDLWGNYAVDGANGTLSENSARLSTPEFLELVAGTVFDYTPASGVSLSFYFYAYEQDGTFIPGINSISDFSTYVQNHPAAKKFRLSLIPTGTTVTPENLSNIVTFNKTVSVVRFVDEKYVDERIGAVEEQIEEIDRDGFKTVVNLNTSSSWEDGGLNTSTGASEANSSRMHTVALELLDSSVFSLTMKTGFALQTWNVMCYTESGTYLGYVNAASVTRGAISSVLLTYPTAKKFRFEVRLSSGTASAANVTNIATFGDTLYEDKYATKQYVDDAIAASGGGGGGGGGGGDTPTAYLDLNDSSLWGTWTIDGNHGNRYDSGSNGKRLATNDMLEIDPTSVFSFTKGASASFIRNTVYFYAYTEDGTFIAGLKDVSTLATFVQNNPTAKKFYLAIINVSGVECSAANLSNIITFNSPIKVSSDYATKTYVDTAVAQGVAPLSSRIDAIDAKMTRSYDLNDPDMWENYGIGTHDGLPYSADGRISTKLLELQAGSTFTITMKSGVTASNANYYCYAADGSYIDNPLIQQTGNVVTIASILTANPTTKFVRLGFVSISGTTASSENIANIATFANTLYTERYVTHEELKEAASGGSGNSILKGKKWYACGDSFTEGVSDPFPDGKYQGQNKSYPLYVGLRNDMTVVNFAVSGSTIGYKAGTSTAQDSFTYPSTGRLYQIPQDVDYITLKFGINDGPGHKNIPLGTISDNTPETEYGAWNVVLQYLITNFPFAKIGVIVSNGCDNTDYPQAAKDCAEKWGVAVLDENFDYNVPLLHRVNGKPNVAQAAHDLRLQQFRVSADNTHPNAHAMEFESTFVEEFLMKL